MTVRGFHVTWMQAALVGAIGGVVWWAMLRAIGAKVQ